MAGQSIQASGHAGGDEAVCALRFLARKIASGGVRLKGHAHGLEVWIEPGTEKRIAFVISQATWLLLRSKDWIAAVECDGSAANASGHLWRLTARGRTHLRRQISQGGVAPAVNASSRPVPAGTQAPRPGINPNESPAGWLARRRDKNGQPLISVEQLAAAERLRADFWFAGMSPRVTTNWSAAETGGPSGQRLSGTDTNDNMIAAKNRVRQAVAAVGPELGSILIDVCCHLKGLEDAERRQGWPQRSAKIVLQLALTRLARHYGLLPAAQSTVASRHPVRHWGAEGYRPRLDSEAL